MERQTSARVPSMAKGSQDKSRRGRPPMYASATERQAARKARCIERASQKTKLDARTPNRLPNRKETNTVRYPAGATTILVSDDATISDSSEASEDALKEEEDEIAPTQAVAKSKPTIKETVASLEAEVRRLTEEVKEERSERIRHHFRIKELEYERVDKIEKEIVWLKKKNDKDEAEDLKGRIKKLEKLNTPRDNKKTAVQGLKDRPRDKEETAIQDLKDRSRDKEETTIQDLNDRIDKFASLLESPSGGISVVEWLQAHEEETGDLYDRVGELRAQNYSLDRCFVTISEFLHRILEKLHGNNLSILIQGRRNQRLSWEKREMIIKNLMRSARDFEENLSKSLDDEDHDEDVLAD